VSVESNTVVLTRLRRRSWWLSAATVGCQIAVINVAWSTSLVTRVAVSALGVLVLGLVGYRQGLVDREVVIREVWGGDTAEVVTHTLTEVHRQLRAAGISVEVHAPKQERPS
jgi:hypothetical protein